MSDISPLREKLCIGAAVSTKMDAKQGHGTGQTQPPNSNGEKKLKEIYEKTVSSVFTELDQVGKDYMLQIMGDRLNLLNTAILSCIDFLTPESVAFWGPDGSITNVRLVLERACDQSLTDNQETTN